MHIIQCPKIFDIYHDKWEHQERFISFFCHFGELILLEETVCENSLSSTLNFILFIIYEVEPNSSPLSLPTLSPILFLTLLPLPFVGVSKNV